MEVFQYNVLYMCYYLELREVSETKSASSLSEISWHSSPSKFVSSSTRQSTSALMLRKTDNFGNRCDVTLLKVRTVNF